MGKPRSQVRKGKEPGYLGYERVKGETEADGYLKSRTQKKKYGKRNPISKQRGGKRKWFSASDKEVNSDVGWS